jgi:nuclear transcription factor Y gamma
MISADAPVLFSQACEHFIRDLTYRAWFWTKESKRRTLQKGDIETCIKKSEIFDFLIDIIDKDDANNMYRRVTINHSHILRATLWHHR